MARTKIVDHARETLEPYRGSNLIVAVSGGLDSVALLDILLELREELNLTLTVAHVDHGLRRASAKDARFVEKLAKGYGLPFALAELNMSDTSNIEAAAREKRYRWLEELRKKKQANYIVTAHQADDQVETLFLHLARGSGLAGLSGMHLESGRILRPLIDVPRKDLTRYVRRRKLAYRLDSTNRSVKFARNRVRRQIITSMQKINPQLIETVSQSMRVLSDEYEVVRTLAERELGKALVKKSPGTVELDAARLKKLRRGLRHVVWREAVRGTVGHLQGFRLTHMENLDELLKRQAGNVIHLPHGLVVHRRSGSILFTVKGGAREPDEVTLKIPGEVTFGEHTIAARLPKTSVKTSRTQIAVSPAVGERLIVRSPKVGDRFKPVGMRGSKLLSDLLTDAKVPRDERPWVPVVTTADGEVVWVAGFRADRRFVPEDEKVISLNISEKNGSRLLG